MVQLFTALKFLAICSLALYNAKPIHAKKHAAKLKDTKSMPPQSNKPDRCVLKTSPLDSINGIEITTDVTCIERHDGCIDDICRFCKTQDNVLTSDLVSCSVIARNPLNRPVKPITPTITPVQTRPKETTIQPTPAPTETTTQSPTPIPTDTTTKSPSPTLDPTPSPTVAWEPSVTPVPSHSTIADGGSDSHESSKGGSTSSENCQLPPTTVAELGMGIKYIEDLTCVNRGMGCTNDCSRQCQVFVTPASQHLIPCPVGTDTSNKNELDLP